MRRQKILSLARQHAKPKQGPLYIRFPDDKPTEIRRLFDPDVVLDVPGLEARSGPLEPFPMDPKKMELEEFVAWFRIYGSLIHTVMDPRDRIWDTDDPNRPDPTTPTTPMERWDRTVDIRLYREAMT